MENRFWHYTFDQQLTGILEDQQIRKTDLHIETGERSAVWFSSNPEWEESANKAIRLPDGSSSESLSKDALFSRGYKAARIEINPKAVHLHPWKKYKQKSGISKEHGRLLEKTGRKMGANPDEWYACFAPIPLSAFLSIEIWNGERWEDIRQFLDSGGSF